MCRLCSHRVSGASAAGKAVAAQKRKKKKERRKELLVFEGFVFSVRK